MKNQGCAALRKLRIALNNYREITAMTKFSIPLFLATSLLIFAACSPEPEPRRMEMANASAAERRTMSSDRIAIQKARNPNLAFEHYYRIKLAEELIRTRFEATVDQCNREDFFGCTLVEASLNEDRDGPYGKVSATLRLRIQSEGIDPLISTAAQDGEIASQSSRAEDLTEAVADTEKRLEMLKSYRARLQALESSAAGDIESLIKVSSELARVQSDIEQAQASRDHLQKRLDLDLLNIQLYADAEDDFINPIARALDRFVYNLASGTSSIITATAWILPWALGLLLIFFILRLLWQRKRR